MNYNYEATTIIMDGADVLYEMICNLTERIKSLPDCKVTESLKKLSANIDMTSEGIYRTMKEIVAEDMTDCKEYLNDNGDFDESDIPTGNDLNDFLDKIADILASDKPVSISADIYINESKDENFDSNKVEKDNA